MLSRIKILLLPIFFLLCSAFAFAQPTQEQKKQLFEKIDNLLVDYIKYSRFLVEGRDRVDAESIANFSKLFVSGETVLPDELSPLYLSKKNLRPKTPPYGSMETEANKMKNRLPVYDPEFDSSYSRLSTFSDSLNIFFKGMETNREGFYRTYNELTAKMDDYNAVLKNQESITERSLDEYIESVNTNYPDGFSVRLLNSVVSFNDISNKQVKVLIEKLTIGKLFSYGVKLQMHDTLLLTIDVSNQYSKLLISNIEMIGYDLVFLNDKDHDFLADEMDNCQDAQGLFQPTGCPPDAEKNFKKNMSGYITERATDSTTAVVYRSQVPPKLESLKDRIDNYNRQINAPPHWMVVLGINTGAVTSSLSNIASGYDMVKETNPSNSFSAGGSIGAYVMGEHYFGKKSNFGIGAGLSFSLISGTIKKEKNEYKVEYRATDIRGDMFTHIISSDNVTLEENVSFSNFSIPIMAIYKGNLTPALGLKIEAGIAVNLYNSAKMKSKNARFNYEAVYNLASTTPNDYFDYSRQSTGEFDANSWLITRDHVSAHVQPGEMVAYFKEMSNDNKFYVWQNDEPIDGNTRSNFTPGISLIFRPSIAINFNRGSTLNLGIYYTSTTFSQSKSNYRMIDISTDGVSEVSKKYNTMMDGVSKMTNSSFGFNVSYSYALFYYLAEWTRARDRLL